MKSSGVIELMKVFTEKEQIEDMIEEYADVFKQHVNEYMHAMQQTQGINIMQCIDINHYDIIDEYNSQTISLSTDVDIAINVKKLHSKLMFSIKPIDEYSIDK